MKDFRARRWQQEDRNPMMTVFEKAGRYPDIIDLSIGDPDLKTPQKIIDLAFADAGAGHTKYTDPWGDPELREEIARFYAEEYGVALGEREIFVSTAGCVAMYLVMEAILDPGDEVLIFDPYFSAYATQVRLGGVRALPRSGRLAAGYGARCAVSDAAHQGAGHQYTQQSHGCVLFPTDAGGGGALCPEERPAGGGG